MAYYSQPLLSSLEYPADKREKNLPMMRKYSDTFVVLISGREGEMEVMRGLILRKSLGFLRSSGRNSSNRSHSLLFSIVSEGRLYSIIRLN